MSGRVECLSWSWPNSCTGRGGGEGGGEGGEGGEGAHSTVLGEAVTAYFFA